MSGINTETLNGTITSQINLTGEVIPKVNLTGVAVVPEWLKGDKGDKGDTGEPFTYEDFTPEQLAALKGADGYTPVKGTDYFTPAEIAQITANATPDLTNYATKTYVDDAVAAGGGSGGTTDLSNYYTKTQTDAAISAAAPDLSGYALKTELPVVPTAISAFTNDAGYLTQHQSLESYATKTYVDTEIAAIDIPVAPDLTPYATKTYVDTAVAGISTPDLTPYALKTEIPDISGKANSADLATVATSGSYADLANKPTIPSVDGLASETYVTNAIAAIPATDLTAYALKTELPSTTGLASEEYVNTQIAAIDIPTVPTNVSAFTNDAGYLTQHQSLTGYATETYVNTQIAAIAPPDLSAYALKTELPTMTNYYTKTEIDATIGDIATLLAAI